MPHKIPIIYWLRQDLRLSDNTALAEAAGQGPVIPVFIWDNTAQQLNGGATRWWLQAALQQLAADFSKHGVTLILRQGNPEQIIPALVQETGARTVTWCRAYEPGLRATDARLVGLLEKNNIAVKIRTGFLLHEPEAIKNGSGLPYRVYTPFSNACRKAHIAAPLAVPKDLSGINGIKSDRLADLHLVPRTAQWPQGLADAWQVGESAAQQHLHDFIDTALANYKTGRDLPGREDTSRLSPYLHFGHISPRQVWYAVMQAMNRQHDPALGGSAERYLLEILWREFSSHLTFHFPDMDRQPLDAAFASFPWHDDPAALQAWQTGRTGYPIVDAGMRQLWQTGWMHNRVRMVTASFLIKHLLIDWRKGMDWFWDTLVDADFGSNTNNWQWVAGCGADAAPFFRIFNPILQGKKFDPAGVYVRRYVPELAKLANIYIHEPWLAPPEELAKAGITLGKTYPLPIVEHDFARKRALEALKKTRG